MITYLKRINKIIIYGVLGLFVTFSNLPELLLSVNASTFQTGTMSEMMRTMGYSMNMSTTALIISTLLISVPIGGLLMKLSIYLSYRITLLIFAKKSGLLYPFPVPYRDYEVTACAFLLPGLLLGGIVCLPMLFLPSISSILGSISTLVFWGTIVWLIAYTIKKYAHDYDKKSLAFSLILLPLIFFCGSLLITLVEVLV